MAEEYLNLAELSAFVPHPKHVILAMTAAGGRSLRPDRDSIAAGRPRDSLISQLPV
jgi:hypothetical protein